MLDFLSSGCINMNKTWALVFAALCGNVHASSVLNVSASSQSDSAFEGPLYSLTDSSGSLSAAAGGSSAWGSIDTSTGVIKLKTNAAIAGDAVQSGAWANAGIYDTLTINHSADYARVAVNVSFAFTGATSYAYSANDAVRNTYLAQHSYDVAAIGRVNANFSLSGIDKNLPPENPEMGFGIYSFDQNLKLDWNAGPWVERNHPSSQFTEVWNNGNYSISYSALGGESYTLSFAGILTVPTNTALSLNYGVNMETLCSVMGACNIAFDGSHTFKLGITALDGQMVSQNGYSYASAPG